MNKLYNISKIIDNTTNPPTIIESNPTITTIAPAPIITNYEAMFDGGCYYPQKQCCKRCCKLSNCFHRKCNCFCRCNKRYVNVCIFRCINISLCRCRGNQKCCCNSNIDF